VYISGNALHQLLPRLLWQLYLQLQDRFFGNRLSISHVIGFVQFGDSLGRMVNLLPFAGSLDHLVLMLQLLLCIACSLL